MNGEPARSTYVDALWQSFFSRSLYLDVARHWRGLGFLYLLLIVVLGWLPDLAKLQMGVQTLHGESAESFIRQIPVIDIRDGTATADVETPYFIKNPKNGKVLAIIDFSGQYTTLDNTSAVVLLTRHEVVTRRSGREVRTYSLAVGSNLALTKCACAMVASHRDLVRGADHAFRGCLCFCVPHMPGIVLCWSGHGFREWVSREAWFQFAVAHRLRCPDSRDYALRADGFVARLAPVSAPIALVDPHRHHGLVRQFRCQGVCDGSGGTTVSAGDVDGKVATPRVTRLRVPESA